MIKKIFVLDLVERRGLFLLEVRRRYPDREDYVSMAQEFLQVFTNQVFWFFLLLCNYIELIAFI